MKVLFVSSEVAPFAKTGGLADVSGALPKALRQRGIDVRVVTPLYAGTSWDDQERLDGALKVPMWWGTASAGVRVGALPESDVPVYFLEYNRYFDRPHLYGPPGDAYPDNLERFTFLSRAALDAAKALGFLPDVIHANDWQTALVPLYADGAATVFTIHNLAYQGVTDGRAMFVTGLAGERYNPGELEHFGALNLMKAALTRSTKLTTVSPTYAREIQTPDFGCGLDGVLRARCGDLVGILNGIDVGVWDPATDPHLPVRFDRDRLEGKEACKAALQAEAGLPVRREAPLFAAIGRLTPQKGFDVLASALDRALDWDMQLVLLGAGDADQHVRFEALAARHPTKVRAWLRFDEALAHRVEAGADFFVMPSRFEPCGLNQMYSLRYGTLPIVRAREVCATRCRATARRPAKVPASSSTIFRPGRSPTPWAGPFHLVRPRRAHARDARTRDGAGLLVERRRAGLRTALCRRLPPPVGAASDRHRSRRSKRSMLSRIASSRDRRARPTPSSAARPPSRARGSPP